MNKFYSLLQKYKVEIKRGDFKNWEYDSIPFEDVWNLRLAMLVESLMKEYDEVIVMRDLDTLCRMIKKYYEAYCDLFKIENGFEWGDTDEVKLTLQLYKITKGLNFNFKELTVYLQAYNTIKNLECRLWRRSRNGI